MAVTVAVKESKTTMQYRGQNTARRVYEVDFEAEVTDEMTAWISALNAGMPQLGTPWHPLSNMYLDNYGDFGVVPTTREVWQFIANYQTPQGQGEAAQPQNIIDPLLRPPIINVDHREHEYVIEKAKNLVALPHGDGKGANRAAGTAGPIVNAAGGTPTIPRTDTESIPKLIIQRNYAALSDIVDVNNKFKRTTNSAAKQGFAAKTLKYMLTKSLGIQVEYDAEGNEYIFWPGVTEIEVVDTTVLELDNVGFDVWDPGAADIVRWRDPVTRQYPGMPVNLDLNGEKGGDVTTTIPWEYLTPISYTELFEGID